MTEESNSVDLGRFKSQLSFGNKLLRLVWGWVWLFAFRPSPRIAFGWRSFLLRCFGAKVGRGVRIYGSAKVYYPPNLELSERVVIGPDVDLYCVDKITVESDAMISQYSYLCTASHDFRQVHLPLTTKPICVKKQAWVCADVFLGPGVTVGEGAVVGARSTTFKDVDPWTVVAGNPAVFIKPREIRSSQTSEGS